MKKIILIALLSTSFTAYAQDTATSSALQFSREESATAPRGLLPFLGLGGGYTGYELNNEVEGSPATLKLLGSFYLESPWVMDIGYGVNNQQFIQSFGSQETAKTGGALEVAARYNFANRWQAGVVANQLYDQGTALTADQADAHFVGLQALKEFNVSHSWLARIGARAQALTNNTDGQVFMYMVDLQLGWNPGAYRPSVQQAATEETPLNVEDTALAEEPLVNDPTLAAPPARPVAAVEPASAIQEISYAEIAGGTAIRFPTAQSQVAGQERTKVTQMAAALRDNADLFDRVEVRGYADTTGTKSVNQEISLQRAESVKNLLESSGLSNVDIAAVGRGSGEPTGVRAQDRRAEVIFIGVKDEAKLREVLSRIE